MLRCLFIAAAASLTVATIWAQQRGMYGGVSTGQMVGTINDPGFASRLGATVSGLPQTQIQIPVERGFFSTPRGIYAAPASNRLWRGGPSRTLVVPWGGAAFYGGFAGYSSYDMAPVTPLVQPVQTSPAVIINQYYTPEVVRPQIKEYTDLPAAAPKQEPKSEPKKESEKPAQAAAPAADADKPTITLLAFTDSSVVAVIAYWLQEGNLHYVTKSFDKRIVPAATLDSELTGQLNRERNVEFKLDAIR